MESAVKLERKFDINGLRLEQITNKKFEVQIRGEKALFCTGDSRSSGSHRTYMLPVVNQLEFMLRRIYWKPGLIIVIDKIRVMNEIKIPPFSEFMQKGIGYTDSALIYRTALIDPWYKIQFHLDWNPMLQYYPGHEDEWNILKHWAIMQRCIDAGRWNVFLGQRSCPAEVVSSPFYEDESVYDGTGIIKSDSATPLRVYDPEFCGNNERRMAFWKPTLENGVIQVPGFYDVDLGDSKVIKRNIEPWIYQAKEG